MTYLEPVCRSALRHSDFVTDFAFTADDNTLVSLSGKQTAHLRDVASGQEGDGGY